MPLKKKRKKKVLKYVFHRLHRWAFGGTLALIAAIVGGWRLTSGRKSILDTLF